MTKPLPHHHGNLREALILAGMRLLAEGGPESLTLRRAAALAGVSHAAPAHHFDGLRGLRTAIATRAYQDFTSAMVSGREAAAQTPVGRLIGVCQGYLDFAIDRAGLFHLLFVSDNLNRDDPALMQESFLAYQVLRAACLPFSAMDLPDPEIEIAVWSMVHGYALLGLNRPDSSKHALVAIPPLDDLVRRIIANGPQNPLALAAHIG